MNSRPCLKNAAEGNVKQGRLGTWMNNVKTSCRSKHEKIEAKQEGSHILGKFI